MRLIDILNKIANGELKEGTKLKVKGLDGYSNEYKFVKNIEDEPQSYDLRDTNGRYVFEEFYLSALEDEVELIEPKHLPDVGKMIEPTDNTKIAELNVKGLCEIFEGKHTVNPNLAFSTALNKLNEVIRVLNKRS